MPAEEKISIYSYINYRKLLRDLYQHRKSENPRFSYRVISSKLGLKSSAHFPNILKGKKKVSTKILPKFAGIFHFDKIESEYFKLLVLFNQAKVFAEKKDLLEKLTFLMHSKVKLVATHQYEYYEKWHYNAIRSLLGIFQLKNNYKQLAAQLIPSITTEEAKDAIMVLEHLGFIKRDKDTYFKPTEQLISTGDEFVSVAINNFHHMALDMAKKSIEGFPRDERELSTLTLGISGDTYKNMLKEMKKFRRKLLEMARTDMKSDRVYQISFQIFPLTKQVKPTSPDSRPISISRDENTDDIPL